MDGHLHGSSGIGHWRSMVSIGSDINRIVAWTQRCSFAYHADEAAEVDALNDISCAIPQGEIAILCGQSGCGKTTYTRLLNGLIPGFYSGDLQGIHMTCGIRAGLAPVESYVGQVGSVFQNPKTQYFNADSTDELAFPCENTGMSPARIRQRVHDVAEQFHIRHLLGRRIMTLSGGQKQQLAVAASTMLAPGLIVMDEPTSNLDMVAIRRLHDMVSRLRADGMTIVIAEHRLAWCADLADRFIVFDHGTILGEYEASDFLAMSEQRVAALGLRGLSVGHTKRGLLGRKTPVFARDIPDFDIHEGEILGLMGSNGVGKSTLARTLCGLAAPLNGMVLLNGTKASRGALTRAGFLVMQDVNYQLFSDSVREEALLGLDGMDDAVRDRCDAVLRDLDLLDSVQRHPMSLSGGQKQRLAIACALMSDKRFIVLDEPTSGLDRLHMTQVGGLLRKLADRGKAVLVVTHDYELAALWCDRIIALQDELHNEQGEEEDRLAWTSM